LLPKFKVGFSNNTTVVAERGLDFPDVEAAAPAPERLQEAPARRHIHVRVFGLAK
jgi:hypothetical protein